MYCNPVYSRVYARSIAIDDGTVLTHPAAWTPLLALHSTGLELNFGRDIGHGHRVWGLDTVYVSVPSHRESTELCQCAL
jgi:hypothetical protein